MTKTRNLKKWLHVLTLFFVTLLFGGYLLSEKLITYKTQEGAISIFHHLSQVVAIVCLLLLALYLSREVKKTFFIRLGISIGLYWCISYFILVTQNLNDFSFKSSDLIKHHFFEVNSWPYLVLLFAVVFLSQFAMKRLAILKKIHHFFEGSWDTNLGLSALMTPIVLCDSKLLETLKQVLVLKKKGHLLDYLSGLGFRLPLMVLLIMVLVYAFWKAVEGIRKNQSTLSLSLISSVLFALVFNYTIQAGIRENGSIFGQYIFLGATLFQLIVLTLFFLLIYVLINRYWYATFVIAGLGLLLTIANSLKFTYRSEPLLLTDLPMVFQLDLILGFLGDAVDFRLLFFAVVLIAWLVVFAIFLHTRYLTNKIVVPLKKQGVLALLAVLSLTSIFSIFSHQEKGAIPKNIPVLSRLHNGLNILFTGYATTARYQSLMFLWVKQATTPVMEKPPHYSQKTMKELALKYQKRAEEINETRSQNITDQTLIFILSESLSDPTRIPSVKLTENVLSNIDQIRSETTGGVMKSDAYGGGTANIETQTLLGLPFYNLSSSIGIYNVQVVPKMSLLPSISDAYAPDDRLFIHLGGLSLYSRSDVYGRLGFKKLIADDKKAIAPTVNEKYGGFPSDDATYQNILDHLDTKESQFFSVVTYQNHTPWSMSEPADLGGEGEGFSVEENERLSHYVRLLKHTDVVTKEFLDKLSGLSKDITVVFYGDHLPGLYPQKAFKKDPDSQFLTDYFIWSNHNNEKKNYPELNSSDFPAAVLAHTNSRVSPYYALLTDVLDQASVDKKKRTKAQEEIADDLKLVQYDLIAGNGYLKNDPDFFKIEK